MVEKHLQIQWLLVQQIKIHTLVINQNISIGSSGNNVAVTWWTNRTGIFNPVIRISNDGGNTFTNMIRLNSISGGTNK